MDTYENVHSIKCNVQLNTLAWNPRKYLLCYAGGEFDDGSGDFRGYLRIFGL